MLNCTRRYTHAKIMMLGYRPLLKASPHDHAAAACSTRPVRHLRLDRACCTRHQPINHPIPKTATIMVDIVAAISILVIAATVVAACLREERRP